MKAIVVTTQNVINYGAVLQSYALHKYLNTLGVCNEYLDVKRKSKVYFIKFKINKYLLAQIYNNFIRVLHLPKTIRKVRRFDEFVKTNINMTRYYNSMETVVENPPKADIYITGGDQMFNVHNGISRINFLDFGNKITKRISYSTSMGNYEVPCAYLPDFIELLNKYDYLSLREQSAKDYISKLCSVPVTTHIDSVFLLSKDEWHSLIFDYCPIIKEKKYILVYELVYHPKLNEAINKLKKLTGLKAVAVSPEAKCRLTTDMIIRDAGPIELLQLIYNAEYVLTSSFHGTCFSILFQKRFFSFVNSEKETRINYLLEKFDLSNRMIKDEVNVSCVNINYDEVIKIIKEEKERAKEYLLKATEISNE